MLSQPASRRLFAAGLLVIVGLPLGYVASHQMASTPSPTAVPAPAPVAPVMPRWSHADLSALLDTIDAATAEGLKPDDYGRDTLAAAITSGASGAETDGLAWSSARAIAHDYADGRIVHREKFDWHIDHSPIALATMDADLAHAVTDGRLRPYLEGLLPQDARYVALRGALHDTPASEADRVRHIRASMERWRWMPRTLGPDYVMVNVPAYRLALYEGDQAVVTHDVIVGAPKTPTPMLSALIGSIIVNPWWTLPPTVLREGKRYSSARGYVYGHAENGETRIRQRPGPMNALGRVKIDMPNPYAIYLHDTPSKAAFERTDRALSHGCIRVKDIAVLAARIGDETKVDSALDTTTTHTLELKKSVPVYIVYFTAGEDEDGKVVTYADPYQRDASLVAALDSTRKPIAT